VGGTVPPRGKIINLASNDCERFCWAGLYASYLFWAPFDAIVVLIIGLFIVGPAFASGYVVLFILVLLQFYLSKRFATLRSRVSTSAFAWSELYLYNFVLFVACQLC